MSAIIQGGGDVFGPVGATDGNLAIFDGTSGKIIESGGSSSGLLIGDISQTGKPSDSIVVPSFADHPDRVFTGTPSALDDHFDGTVLDGKWTNTQTASITNPVCQVLGSRLTLAGGSPGGADGVAYANTVYATLPNTNDFTITVRADAILYSRPFSGSIGYFDIRLYNATSNLGCAYRFYNAWASTPQVPTLNCAVYGGTGLATQVTSWFISTIPKYLKMVFAAATRIVTLFYSDDGNMYHQWTVVTAAQSGFTAVILPQTLRMYAVFTNAAYGLVHIDWVKFTNP